jgi:hypothetical protein
LRNVLLEHHLLVHRVQLQWALLEHHLLVHRVQLQWVLLEHLLLVLRVQNLLLHLLLVGVLD